ncbi:MAG: hypothetical protein QG661_3145, partial [Actinomycetota bacterium]|nr:hypothetical protein [Actinomycetota bacterium]
GDAFTELAPVDEVAAAMAVPTPSASGIGCESGAAGTG